MTIINESGLYSVILRSDKPEEDEWGTLNTPLSRISSSRMLDAVASPPPMRFSFYFPAATYVVAK